MLALTKPETIHDMVRLCLGILYERVLRLESVLAKAKAGVESEA